jgi:DNA-binding NarL/FixJ family response regulator
MAARQILRAVPGVKVLVLTSYDDEECVKEMMAAGVSGFLNKQSAANELPQAIRNARRGVQSLSAGIAQRMRNQRHSSFKEASESKSPSQLTSRELEVLQLIADGSSNKEAAVTLGISIKTIEKHRQQVMNKLNIHEIAGLTRYALSRNIIERKVPQPLSRN